LTTGWQFRPAKQIQRLMAVDAMRRLGNFFPLSEYRYIGMGGYEFVDFDLVHRALGVHRMISIESKVAEDRLKFNRPFPEIDIEIGTSNDILPTLALDGPLIVWLDYCGRLDHSVLQDVLLLGEQLRAGSMLLVTINATAGDPTDERLSELEARVGSARIPLDVSSDNDLVGRATAEVQRRILLTEVNAGLGKRSDAMRFEQIINVQYRDTQRMQTLGGVFVDPAHDSMLAAADFGSLDHVRTGQDALKIKVPVLTAREVLKLESEIKKGKPAPSLAWLKDEEANSFADLHRWYPAVPAPM
jgi:hypothetical protein